MKLEVQIELIGHELFPGYDIGTWAFMMDEAHGPV